MNMDEYEYLEGRITDIVSKLECLEQKVEDLFTELHAQYASKTESAMKQE
ncbi:MAG: hypothetical protein MRJ65_15435 [Candidatus Brocadiaceae bacterium]|nr:hypothetical protein [Candidatus Brocadiaceae bacterium]